MIQTSIRGLRPDDRQAWGVLWRGYLAFYETTLDAEIYNTTFARLLGENVPEMGCFIAERDGIPVGLVHYIFHRHCWRVENVCYLQDLFAAPETRGTGVGRALIEAVYAEADRQGCPSVYWMTQDFNATARQLYDRIADKTPFIKYAR